MYEETPIIEPIIEAPAHMTDAPSPPLQSPSAAFPLAGVPPKLPARRTSLGRKVVGCIAHVFLFVVLFAGGMWLGTIIHSLVSLRPPTTPATDEQALPPGAPADVEPTVSAGNAAWVRHHVIRSTTKEAIEGVRFQLPPDVLAPVCDGASCVSQGTYLPGGTRFTVAARGAGQGLRFIRGAVITDASGKAFTTTETTVAGRYALEYTGTFRGTTIGGYTFNRMRGVMIEVSDSLTLEMNHFAPAGVASDFVSDDTLFDQILKTVELPPSSSTPTAPPTPIPENF